MRAGHRARPSFLPQHPCHSRACGDGAGSARCPVPSGGRTGSDPTAAHHAIGAAQLWAPREGSLKQLNLDLGHRRARWPGRAQKQESRQAGEGAPEPHPHGRGRPTSFLL